MPTTRPRHMITETDEIARAIGKWAGDFSDVFPPNAAQLLNNEWPE